MLLAILLSLFAIPQQTYSGCTVSIANGVVTITCPVSQPPLTIVTPVALPPATVGVPYSVNLASLVKPAGGTPPYKFKDVTGFPAWTRLTPDGVLSGTPVAPCSCVLKFNVSDSSGQTLPVSSAPSKGVPLNVQVPQVISRSIHVIAAGPTISLD